MLREALKKKNGLGTQHFLGSIKNNKSVLTCSKIVQRPCNCYTSCTNGLSHRLPPSTAAKLQEKLPLALAHTYQTASSLAIVAQSNWPGLALPIDEHLRWCLIGSVASALFMRGGNNRLKSFLGLIWGLPVAAISCSPFPLHPTVD